MNSESNSNEGHPAVLAAQAKHGNPQKLNPHLLDWTDKYYRQIMLVAMLLELALLLWIAIRR